MKFINVSVFYKMVSHIILPTFYVPKDSDVIHENIVRPSWEFYCFENGILSNGIDLEDGIVCEQTYTITDISGILYHMDLICPGDYTEPVHDIIKSNLFHADTMIYNGVIHNAYITPCSTLTVVKTGTSVRIVRVHDTYWPGWGMNADI